MVTGVTSKELFLTSDSLSSIEASQCHLSVLLMRDNLSYCVTKLDDHKVLAIGNGSREQSKCLNELKKVLKTIGPDFRSATVATGGEPFTLIPDNLYQPSKSSELLKFTYGENVDQINSEVIAESDMRVVFGYDQSIVEEIQSLVPVARHHCNEGLFIQNLRRLHRFSDKAFIHLDIQPGFVSCYVLHGHELVLSNWYNVAGENDVLYHAVNLVQQLKLEQEKFEVKVSGEISEGDDLWKLLEKYLPSVSMTDTLQTSTLESSIQLETPARFMALFNQYACAL